jgi:phage portal protein BeeE
VGVKEWFARRDDADTAWTRNFSADATFEQWLGQVGTDFLPPDTQAWPDPAQWTPSVRDAFVSGDFGSYAWMYKTQPSVYTVVEFLSWQVSQCSLKSYDRVGDGDRRHLTNSEVEQTISHPAPGLTYARMMHGTVADLGVYGNGYWALMDGSDGLPFDGYVIVPICAEFMRPLGGNVLEAAEYEWEMGGQKHRLPAEKVCHFRRYNPTDRRIGISPLQPLRGILREDFESTRYREVLWKTAARIGGFIRRNPEKSSAPMDPESREHFRAGLEKFSKGGNREGQWMLLEDGEIPVPMAFSPRDAEFIDRARSVQLERPVPPSVVPRHAPAVDAPHRGRS